MLSQQYLNTLEYTGGNAESFLHLVFIPIGIFNPLGNSTQTLQSEVMYLQESLSETHPKAGVVLRNTGEVYLDYTEGSFISGSL